MSKVSKALSSKRVGLTLVELIVVLAIIAIIGAILIPNVMSAVDRARLRSDIQSARVLQNAIDAYNAEQATPIPATTPMDGTGNAPILARLHRAGYISDRQARPQTYGAVFNTRNQLEVIIDISDAQDNIRTTIYRQLTERERQYVVGGIAGT